MLSASLIGNAQRPTAHPATLDVFQRLRWFNFLMGLLHTGQGIAILLLSTGFSLPVTAAFLEFDTTTWSLNPSLETLAELQIGPMVSTFLFISAVAHFLISSPSIYQWYVDNLRKGINYARWVEYSFSASLMIVIIAMLVGIYDIASLILLFAVNATMILFGLMMELHNQATESTNWTAFVFGSIAGIVPWLVIGIYLAGAGSAEGSVPTFVYGIYGSIFLFFNVFAINMFLQYQKVGPWREYLYGERVYILLSLIAKSALAWQVFAGTLRPV